MNDTAPLGYSPTVPSLFRRKSADVATPEVSEEVSDAASRPKGYTPSKRELGQATPKRQSTARKVNAEAPANRREAMKQMRERQRQERVEATEGMRAGFAHLIAALAAEGTSRVYGVDLINRGYEGFENKLAALGAHVERL